MNLRTFKNYINKQAHFNANTANASFKAKNFSFIAKHVYQATEIHKICLEE